MRKKVISHAAFIGGKKTCRSIPGRGALAAYSIFAQGNVPYRRHIEIFRGLKCNFLNFAELESVADIEKKVEFYLSEHNEVIPKVILQGATPKEKYLNLWHQSDIDKLKKGLNLAQETRHSSFRNQRCHACTS